MNLKLSTLYVGDLHPEVTESMLVEKFSPVGQIHSVRICRCWKTRTSLGYAYVNFYQQPDAERALVTLNYDLLMGKPMRVMWSQRDSSLRKSGVGNLSVKNLDLTTTDTTALYELFSVFGKVLSCKVVTYKKGPKGYGYVQFETREAAKMAQEKLDGEVFNHNQISVEHFKSREEREGEANGYTQGFSNKQNEGLVLYVNNLSDYINDDFLLKKFSKYETVTGVKVMRDNGRSRGYGFVEFSSAEEAMKAKEEINDTVWGTKKVSVNLAKWSKACQNGPMHSNVQKTEKVQTQKMDFGPRVLVKATRKSVTVTSQDPAVKEGPVPLQYPAVKEGPVPLHNPAVKEGAVQMYEPAVKEGPDPPQDPAVKEGPVTLQDPDVIEGPAPLQDPAVKNELRPLHDPAVKNELPPLHGPAVKEGPSPPQDPAVKEAPNPPQDPAVEEEQFLEPAGEGKPEPPQDGDDAPAKLPDTSVEAKAAPPHDPAAEEKPAMPLVPAAEGEAAPPQDPTAEQKSAPPQDHGSSETSSISWTLKIVSVAQEEPNRNE